MNLRTVSAVLWAAAALSFAAPLLTAESWKPIEPAHLALKAPVVDPNADAEVLFWEIGAAWRSKLRSRKTTFSHYIRLKVFTERGRESQSTIDIPFSNSDEVSDIAARTIRADGTIQELAKDAFHERTIKRNGRPDRRVMSINLPGVEAGSIIEYQYQLTFHDFLADATFLLQQEIPVQSLTLSILPISDARKAPAMRSHSFHCQTPPFAQDFRGAYVTTLSNVPAFREEPAMPPEAEVRPWLLVYYSEDKKRTADKFWHDFSRKVHRQFEEGARVSDAVRKAAGHAVGDASAPEEKLRRIFEFCRTSIRLRPPAPGETATAKRTQSPANTLLQKAGTATDINMLFAAMARAAGFDAREARICDRGRYFFDTSFLDGFLLDRPVIAIPEGDRWRLFDAASPYESFGMLPWQAEGTAALIASPKGAVNLTTKLSPPEKSLSKRTATLGLAPDGSLEGDVRVELFGHAAAEARRTMHDEPALQREEQLTQAIRRRIATAQLSAVRIENADGPSEPLIESYHIRVPGYAHRAGKRLFLQPAFFQNGAEARFPASRRSHPVYFHYPWLEQDNITIRLPDGFTPESAATPEPLAGKLGKYEVTYRQDGSSLVFNRSLRFGDDAALLFPVSDYPQLKKIFDWVYKSDNYTLSLRQSDAP
jgi:hypothetical protein